MNAIYRKITSIGEKKVVREIVVESSMGIASGDVLNKMVLALENNLHPIIADRFPRGSVPLSEFLEKDAKAASGRLHDFECANDDSHRDSINAEDREAAWKRIEADGWVVRQGETYCELCAPTLAETH